MDHRAQTTTAVMVMKTTKLRNENGSYDGAAANRYEGKEENGTLRRLASIIVIRGI